MNFEMHIAVLVCKGKSLSCKSQKDHWADNNFLVLTIITSGFKKYSTEADHHITGVTELSKNFLKDLELSFVRTE